jgi:3-oxoadipate enol-lactonase
LIASTGAPVHHEVAGEGAPVVFLHSGISDSRMWDPQWEAFAATHRVVRCDFRGFGRSQLPAGRFAHPVDTVELLDALALGPLTLIGSSMGGGVALQVAVARPDLVSRLVLASAGVRGHQWSEGVTRAWEQEEQAFARGDFDGAVEVTLRTWVDGPARSAGDVDPGVRAKVGEMQRRVYELDRPDAEEEALVTDIGERLGEIQVPTLVVVGALDVPDMLAIADRFEREIPDTRRVTIDGAAHLPSLERPDEFNRVVLEFLAESGG